MPKTSQTSLTPSLSKLWSNLRPTPNKSQPTKLKRSKMKNKSSRIQTISRFRSSRIPMRKWFKTTLENF